jgi:hypothetical protein
LRVIGINRGRKNAADSVAAWPPVIKRDKTRKKPENAGFSRWVDLAFKSGWNSLI